MSDDVVSDDIIRKAEDGAEALHEVADALESIGADSLGHPDAVDLFKEHPDAYTALMKFDEPFSRLSGDDGSSGFRVDDTLR